MSTYQEQAFRSTTADRPVIELDVGARAEFITKTYLHVFAAMVAFVLFEVVFFAAGIAESLAKLVSGNGWFLFLGGYMLVAWMASQFAWRARTLPIQYAGLTAFTALEALVFAPILWIAANYFPGVITQAAIVTLGITAALTMIVFITRKDFSFLRSFLWIGGIAVLGLFLLTGLTNFQVGTWVFGAIALLMCGSILYNTSNILHHYPSDRYVGAAQALFASIATLFWYILQIFMSRD